MSLPLPVAPPASAVELRLLILDDVAWDTELMQRELRDKQVRFAARICQNESDFRRALAEFKPDLILSDYNIPGFSGAAALDLARAILPEVPFIIVSGAIGEENVAALLGSGATDYVAKNNLSRLGPAATRALREKQMRSEARRTIQGLRETIEVLRDTKRSFKSKALGQLREKLEELVETMPWWCRHP